MPEIKLSKNELYFMDGVLEDDLDFAEVGTKTVTITEVVEDLIAVYFATGESMTWKIIGIVILVAFPFAIIGELIVDRAEWFKALKKLIYK